MKDLEIQDYQESGAVLSRGERVFFGGVARGMVQMVKGPQKRGESFALEMGFPGEMLTRCWVTLLSALRTWLVSSSHRSCN